jgi:FixJ family two-component response regulator
VSKDKFIAVIDDDEPFRTALTELLDGMAFSARGFNSADEFIASGNAESCDCIITDIHMPGMSGFDLLRLLRSKSLPTPVILVTANLDPVSEVDAESIGATCLLTKPFDSAVLMTCLDKALSATA